MQRAKESEEREKSTGMAGRTIDALADQTVPGDDRAKRKRRLLEGPEEFREIRDDQRKSRRGR